MPNILLLLLISCLAIFATNLSAKTLSDQNSDNPDGEAVILMYHHFGEDTPPSTSVTPAQFEQHLNHLATNDFNVWPISKLLNAWENDVPVPPKTVVLTVDDAYISVYNQAWLQLKPYGWPLSVFVNADYIDKKFGNYMSWEQMRELQAAGVEFLNHGFSHQAMRPLKGESWQEAKQRILHELNHNQQRLAEELSVSAKIFAYPFGEYSEKTADLIAKQGYTGLAQVSGAVNKFSDKRALNRFPMAVNFAGLDDFILKVNTKPLPLKNHQPFEPIVRNIPAENPPKMQLEFSQKLNNLNCFTSLGEPLNLDWQGSILTIQAKKSLKPPRDRYACTAQSSEPGRWHWWGHLWIIED